MTLLNPLPLESMHAVLDGKAALISLVLVIVDMLPGLFPTHHLISQTDRVSLRSFQVFGRRSKAR